MKKFRIPRKQKKRLHNIFSTPIISEAYLMVDILVASAKIQKQINHKRAYHTFDEDYYLLMEQQTKLVETVVGQLNKLGVSLKNNTNAKDKYVYQYNELTATP